VKDSLPVFSDSLTACAGRVLMEQKIELRAFMAALSIEGIAPRTIAVLTQTHQTTVRRWACRIKEGGLLTDLPRSGRPRTFSQAARLMTIAVYCQQNPPLPGIHTWSLRDAQRHFNERPEILGAPIGRATLQRILLEHALRPHRRSYYLQITDPDFFPKMEHIVDVYLNPPQNLFCFDECTCLQALKRVSPDMPPDTNQPTQEGFDYRRNGTTDLMAFLNPATGEVYGQCTPNHDRHTLTRVFTAHVETLPHDAVIHYFHASWLNMVEIWFGILKSKCLRYGHFNSVEQLIHDILAFIQTWNAHFAHPFSWSYTGEGLHAKAVRRFCRLLAIETDQMDCAYLRKQLLLMSNIAESYTELIPAANWHQLLELATAKDDYITHIIVDDTKPRRKRAAEKAYARFRDAVVHRQQPLTKAS